MLGMTSGSVKIPVPFEYGELSVVYYPRLLHKVRNYIFTKLRLLLHYQVKMLLQGEWSMPKTNAGLSRRSELIQKTVAYVTDVTDPSDLSGCKKQVFVLLAYFTINYF